MDYSVNPYLFSHFNHKNVIIYYPQNYQLIDKIENKRKTRFANLIKSSPLILLYVTYFVKFVVKIQSWFM